MKTRKQTASSSPGSRLSKTKYTTRSSKAETPDGRKTPRKSQKAVRRLTGTQALEKFRGQLSSRVIPDDLPCREAQYDTIYNFIDNNLKSKTSRTLYISGVPGTGKTATARKVIEDMKDEERDGVDFAEVNGMRLADPSQVYTEIQRQLLEDKKVSASTALQKLHQFFTEEDCRKVSTVLLIDELDLLCTRRQNVLYQLFEWATREEARLTILAIANTLDLPERLLSHRVSSRMGMSRLPFQPYTHKEMEAILGSRLAGCDCVESDAVELVSRKVAAVSGDLRKAMEIFRRAIDISLEKGLDTLSITEVQDAVKDLANSSESEAVRHCSVQEKKVLEGVVAEYKRTGNEEISFSRLIHAYEDACRLRENGLRPLSPEGLMALCGALSRSSLLVACPGLSDWSKKYRLGMSVDDVLLALNMDKEGFC